MKPRVAVTMGDPGGVGPEVIIKALLRKEVQQELTPFVFGDLNVLNATAAQVGAEVEFVAVEDPLPKEHPGGDTVPVVEPCKACNDFTRGEVSSHNGKASYSYIAAAARNVLESRADALCTAPISKEALHMAGVDFPGHTEMLAHFCRQQTVRMMLVGGGLRVVLQTIHVALRDVPGLITIEGIRESLRIIRNFAAEAGQDFPRIAVCGLNPHAGEGGQFGREEIDVITPAIKSMRSEGMNVIGPVPGDTVFHRALEGEFDYVLAMYHDQALIPVKTLDFHGGVNVTLGLPLLRTSPDHGTAFGIAGKNVANENSMVAAMLYAAELARRRANI